MLIVVPVRTDREVTFSLTPLKENGAKAYIESSTDHVSRGGTSTVRLALGTSRKPDQDTGAQLRAEPESAVRADMGFRLRRATRAFSDFTFQLRLGLRRASSVRCGGAGRAGTGAPASGVRGG